MPDNYTSNLVSVAKAEDTYDLLQHIAWTDTIRPTLEKEIHRYSQMLIADALGTPSALGGLTREQVAGMCYGIQCIIRLLEKILKDGERALRELRDSGISLQHNQ